MAFQKKQAGDLSLKTDKPAAPQASTAPTPAPNEPTNWQLLNIIQSLQKELSEMRKGATITTEKKVYEWPRAYSFRLIDGKPIASFRMIKNKVNRDYQEGGYRVEQVVEVQYVDGSSEKMNYDDYVQNYTTSEKLIVENGDIERKADGQWFTFRVNNHGLIEFGDFQVHESNIN